MCHFTNAGVFARYVCFVLMLIASGLTRAEATSQSFSHKAQADGAMIATANMCMIPKASINALIYHQKKATLNEAKTHGVAFDAAQYDNNVILGFESTNQLLAQQTTSEEAMIALCDGLESKINVMLAE